MEQVYDNGVLTDANSIFDTPEVAAQSAFDWQKLTGGILGRWVDAEFTQRYNPKSAPQQTQGNDGRNTPAGRLDLRIGTRTVPGWAVVAGAVVAGVVLWKVLS